MNVFALYMYTNTYMYIHDTHQGKNAGGTE